ncbi:SH3 domain-containing protein [Intestinibacter bartlettii]|uniref:C40 family peptidase n=1 Tax=Intestinibacter bartlettii TaxID=261299 RepID=UPI003A1AD573
MSINKKYIIASAMMASVALPLMNASHVDAATDMRTVTASSLNFRTGPSTSYSIINVLMNGQKVEYISTSGSWLKVKYNGVTGYVHGDYVTKGTTDNSTTGTTKYVSASVGLNVRSGAGTSYSKLGKLEYKEKVTVLSTSNGWSKINYNGKTGYVDSSYLQSTVPGSNGNNANNNNNTVSTKANEVIAYAKTLLGKPYVWGAQGPNSFDCSGFTYYVFKNKAGIVLPRTSSAQSKYGTYVSKSNLKAGDLVFFDTNGANDGNVSHVGMYIGNGQMIHASYGQKKIVIANFNDSYYQKAYVNARRVL